MEKARAISAKIYLRWANNGSGYLDEFSVSSVADLEKKLREKEKANLAPFKEIAVPQDYETWDKARLVEYWSKTALSTPGLNRDGVSPGSRNRIKAAINALSVTPPSAQAKEPEPQVEELTVPVADTQNAEEASPADELTRLQEEMSSVSDSIEAADTLSPEPVSKKSSSTWLYVVALIILIAAVIFLVVYASKSFGKQQTASATPSEPEEDAPVRRRSVVSGIAETPRSKQQPAANASEISKIREKYAENLAAKQEEIRMLTNEVMNLRDENKRLAADNEHLRLDASRLRKQLENTGLEESASVPSASAPRRNSTETTSETREIFLGRVNANGVFVRADRTFNPRQSIYRLRTSDGYTGTFRVVDDSSVVEVTFPNPEEMLGGGCIAMDITNTRGKEEIITESAGTAVFENNCWRVIRKAKIRYE